MVEIDVNMCNNFKKYAPVLRGNPMFMPEYPVPLIEVLGEQLEVSEEDYARIQYALSQPHNSFTIVGDKYTRARNQIPYLVIKRFENEMFMDCMYGIKFRILGNKRNFNSYVELDCEMYLNSVSEAMRVKAKVYYDLDIVNKLEVDKLYILDCYMYVYDEENVEMKIEKIHKYNPLLTAVKMEVKDTFDTYPILTPTLPIPNTLPLGIPGEGGRASALT